MNDIESNFSPKEVALAIGVSESSLKRWIDRGRLRADRTVGGHRRVCLAEVVRFIRQSNLSVLRPEALGLRDLKTLQEARLGELDDLDRLVEYLTGGEMELARGVILGSYLSVKSVAEICDGPLQGALDRIGRLWLKGTEGILVEHRATDICIQALNQLRILIPSERAAPVAIGGAPSGDPYILPSLCAATILASEGFKTINLGPDVPFDSLLEGIRLYRPRLLWLSVSRVQSPGKLGREFSKFSKETNRFGLPLMVGGRERSRIEVSAGRSIHKGGSMVELASFARGVLTNRDWRRSSPQSPD